VREASRSLAGLRPTRAEKDALRASWGVDVAVAVRQRLGHSRTPNRPMR